MSHAKQAAKVKLPFSVKSGTDLHVSTASTLAVDKWHAGEYYKYPIDDWDDYLRLSKQHFESDYYKKRAVPERTLSDFDRLRTLGTGSFGRVILVRGRFDDNFYAMKVIDKDRVIKTKQVEHTYNEKRILSAFRFPFTIHMDFFFLDTTNLYFILPFIQGGEMFTYLRKVGKFSEPLTRFYAVQVILALEYMHYNDIIYRDLKPENILINKDGYLKLTDFGFCKLIKGRTYTLCGTPEYLAPEVINNKGYGFSADWWSTGVLLYEMAAGYPPFYAKEPMKIYEKIVAGKYAMPKIFSDELKDLIKNILQTDLSKRYGNLRRGVRDIKDHNFFLGCRWLDILNKRIPAPYVPKLKGVGDASNFDNYEEVPLVISAKDKYAKEFAEF